MLGFPVLIVNFKAYKKATGRNAVKLAKTCERIAKNTRTSIAVAVQHTDIRAVASAVRIPVLAQHIDAINYGSHTGSILPEALKEAGAVGSLLNHSEKKVGIETAGKTITRMKKLGLVSVACASVPNEALELDFFKPDIIAIEPPELIGGNLAVSKAKPEIITEALHAVRKAKLICGAGIKTKDDAEKAVALGAKGILVASGVVEAESPAKALKELAEGLKYAKK